MKIGPPTIRPAGYAITTSTGLMRPALRRRAILHHFAPFHAISLRIISILLLYVNVVSYSNALGRNDLPRLFNPLG